MKVVQINAINRFGSTGTNTFELHEFLKTKGHESFIICTNDNNPEDNIFRIGSNIDYKIHAFLSRVTGLQGYYSSYPTKQLIRKLNLIKPDIVLLGNLHSNYINIGLLLKYLGEKNIATVNVLHDCWSFTGHCCHYTKIGCMKWQTECHSCPLLSQDNTSLIDRSTKIFRDKKRWFSGINKLGVIGVSKWIRNEGEISPIFPSQTKFTDIYNWIDLKTFHPGDKQSSRSKLNLKLDQFYAISVSQEWIPEKGLNIILSLATELQEIQFLLIGKKPNLAEVPENVFFIGSILNKNDLSSYYQASDVYLNLSSQETFGKVSAEALSCGLPVIAGNNTASPEVVGKCGRIVNLKDMIQIRNVLKQFVSGQIQVSPIDCRNHAVVNFDKNTNLGKYLNFFESLSKQD